ncbi:MAG: DUF3307 domain-containing protein [Methyloceanibacter sp.]|nr:DUF3307 domain-containing protein [Methyloceanibacter sp.]
MPQLALLVLAAVAVLMFKHAVADFYLQTAYQYLNKGKYGHPGGFIHAGIHVALTPLVYLVLLPGSLLMAGAIALGEFLLHYHIDWLKEQIIHRNGWTAQDRGFWYALGTDQLVHGLTYLAIVAVLVMAAAT